MSMDKISLSLSPFHPYRIQFKLILHTTHLIVVCQIFIINLVDGRFLSQLLPVITRFVDFNFQSSAAFLSNNEPG